MGRKHYCHHHLLVFPPLLWMKHDGFLGGFLIHVVDQVLLVVQCPAISQPLGDGHQAVQCCEVRSASEYNQKQNWMFLVNVSIREDECHSLGSLWALVRNCNISTTTAPAPRVSPAVTPETSRRPTSP